MIDDSQQAQKAMAELYRKAAIGHANSATIVHDFLVNNGLPREDSTWISLQNLIGLATECAYKAYLAAKNVEKKTLQKWGVGHNLQALHNMSCERGLGDDIADVDGTPLVEMLTRVIDSLGANHGDYSYRYLEGDAFYTLHGGQSTENAINTVHMLANVAERHINPVAA